MFMLGRALMRARSASRRRIVREPRRDRHVVVERRGDRLGDAHHLAGWRRCGGHASACAAHGDDRQIVRQAFQRRVAARPADAVEEHVAAADGGDELVPAQPRQEYAMIGRLEADARRPAQGARWNRSVTGGPPNWTKENELAVAGLARDARETPRRIAADICTATARTRTRWRPDASRARRASAATGAVVTGS